MHDGARHSVFTLHNGVELDRVIHDDVFVALQYLQPGAIRGKAIFADPRLPSPNPPGTRYRLVLALFLGAWGG